MSGGERLDPAMREMLGKALDQMPEPDEACVEAVVVLHGGAMPERIVAAAMHDGSRTFAIGPPAGHGAVLKAWLAGGGTDPKRLVHGFLTSRGRFIDRKEGYRVAAACGQVRAREDGVALVSEDLWVVREDV